VKWTGRYDPDALDSLADAELQLLLTFCVTFLGEGGYVRNPYLRAHLTEVLALFVPKKEAAGGKGGGGSAAGGFAASRMASVLAGHTLARRLLAPALMGFFVDIEFTGAHTQARARCGLSARRRASRRALCLPVAPSHRRD
jgi:hypothetical protein